MSIASMTGRDTVTIKRKSTTQGPAGSPISTWNTANRGSNPTSASCRIQAMAPDEKVEYGMSASDRAWKIYFSTDPVITLQDRVDFTDVGGAARIGYTHEASFDWDNQGRLWRTLVIEKGSTK